MTCSHEGNDEQTENEKREEELKKKKEKKNESTKLKRGEDPEENGKSID